MNSIRQSPPLDKWVKKLVNIFLLLMIVELVVGGGGRFFEIGPVTLRMLFYFLAIPLSVVLIWLKQRVDRQVFYWILAYSVVLLVGTIVGIVNGNPLDLIIEDLKPLIFFYVLPFFSITINNRKQLDSVIAVIQRSSLFLGFSYIMLILFILTGIINFNAFYTLMEPYGEVLFRGGQLFFYKGFLFLCVGFFFTFHPGKINKFFSLVLFVAIVLTLTRGFILMTILVTIFHLVFLYRNKIVSFLVLMGLVAAILIAIPFYLEGLGDRAESDAIRVTQFQEVIDKTNPINFFIGDGFGKGIPIRPIHMEISFLEIFSKQGVLGILFWLILFVVISYKFLIIYKSKKNVNYLAPFYLSVTFVYLQSMTNPFLNNPIGMSIVLISLVVFQIKDLAPESHIKD